MTLSKNMSTLMGLSVGLVVAGGIFLFMLAIQHFSTSTKVQALQSPPAPLVTLVPSTPFPAPVLETRTTSGDSLIQRLDIPKEDVFQDIQKSVNTLYVGVSPFPSPSP